nr:hypothetical protein [Clostridiales bacterium]
MISLLKGIGEKVDFIATLMGKLIFYPLIVLLILVLLKPILLGFNTPEPIIAVISSIISLIRYYFEVIGNCIGNLLALGK